MSKAGHGGAGANVPTGWVDLTELDEETAKKVYDGSIKDDAVTAWTEVEFDEMAEMCGRCPLSWDKGRGCIGAFGPDDSKLPGIAEKAGCPIVASVPETVRSGKRYTAEDAPALLREIEESGTVESVTTTNVENTSMAGYQVGRRAPANGPPPARPPAADLRQ